jgi:CRP-like cAMP-binding protein
MMTNPLRKFELFANVSDERLPDIARQISWRTYDNGQQIVDHLDTSNDVYFVAEGRVRATVHSFSGREVTYRVIDAGDFFGEYAAIDGEARSANIVARTNCVIGVMSAAAFNNVVRTNEAVTGAILKRFVGQIRVLSERVFEYSTMAVISRVRAELVRLADDAELSNGELVISPSPTHADLASRVSTHREAVTRELNQLADLGIVERRGNALVINDIEGLRDLLEIETGQ